MPITGDPSLPDYYNVRDEYPYCEAKILDQGECGSCWGFAASGILSDRLCIETKGKINLTLSPQDMVNCAFENYGCMGGYLIPSVDFLITEGVSTHSCKPYLYDKGSCDFKCENKETYKKYFCEASSMKIMTSIEEMQREIYKHGPIMVGLIVWEDMYNYESGIYSPTTGDIAGGHAIRAVGWGHDSKGELYWIC